MDDFWSVFTYRRRMLAQVSVRGAFSFFPNTGAHALDITATNTGAVTVTLTSAQFRIKGKAERPAPTRWLIQTPSPLPIVLEPGRHWDGNVGIETVEASLADLYSGDSQWKVRPFVRDASGQTYEADNWLEIGRR